MYYGDRAPASTVYFNFNTASFADGSPITLAGTPSLAVYKNSLTQSTAGLTLTVDYDSVTGLHHVVVDTSADGTFYAAGNDFTVVIAAGTVGGTSVVGRVVGSFSLNNVSATAANILSAALTESYAADGVAPTLSQIVFMIWSLIAERSISGTTLTAKKLDGSTSSMTFTLDSATVPTSQTRAS